MDIIEAKDAPAAIGPYSQAVKAGNTLYLSGQVPFDPANGQVVGDTMCAQAKQTFANLTAVLKQAGLTKDNIAKTTIYLKNFDDFSELNAAYEEFMGDWRPARVCVEVSRMPKGVLMEMDAIAFIE